MSTDQTTSQLIINKLTKEQYEALTSPSETELYLTPDTTEQDIADAVSTHNTSSSAHSSLFDSKVTANTAITASTTKKLVTYDSKGLVTGGSALASSDVTGALGYTPYNSTNPNNYITSSALNGYATQTWVGQQGYITGITSLDVTDALGYVPYSSANPNNYISGITSSMVTTALGYVPYSSANPNNYISGITSSMVTTALGYTPVNPNDLSEYTADEVNTLWESIE